MKHCVVKHATRTHVHDASARQSVDEARRREEGGVVHRGEIELGDEVDNSARDTTMCKERR